MFILGAQPNTPSQLPGFKIVAAGTWGSAHCRGGMNLATVSQPEQIPAIVDLYEEQNQGENKPCVAGKEMKGAQSRLFLHL